MSPYVVGQWGRYWGRRCFCGRSSSCSATYQRRTTNDGIGTLYFCADCRMQAMVEIGEESALQRDRKVGTRDRSEGTLKVD
jgi:hypothetical protein